jgi:hypothetical protein
MSNLTNLSRSLSKSIRHSLDSIATLMEPESTESGEWFLTSLRVQHYHSSSTSMIDPSSCMDEIPTPFLTSTVLPIHLNTLRSYDWTLQKLFKIYYGSIVGRQTQWKLREYLLGSNSAKGENKECGEFGCEEDTNVKVKIKAFWLQTHILESDGFGNDKRIIVMLEREGWYAMLEKMRRAADVGKGRVLLNLVVDRDVDCFESDSM